MYINVSQWLFKIPLVLFILFFSVPMCILFSTLPHPQSFFFSPPSKHQQPTLPSSILPARALFIEFGFFIEPGYLLTSKESELGSKNRRDSATFVFPNQAYLPQYAPFITCKLHDVIFLYR